MLRFLTAGESHGPLQVAILEGMLSGLSVNHKDINKELKKRHLDLGRGGRSAIETDNVEILAGIRHGKTIGSPIALIVKNHDFTNWKTTMQVEPVRSNLQEGKVTNPRPGHADLTGSIKYGHKDIRNTLERASARETVMRVAVGAVCKKLLKEFNIKISSHTIQIGKVKLINTNTSFQSIEKVFEVDPDIRCIDPLTRKKMKNEILTARAQKDTLGGIIEIIAKNIPLGLGSHVHWDRKLDGLISQALMSIPSVKAVEIGEGIKIAGQKGSEVHDEIYPLLVPPSDECFAHIGGVARSFQRKTNRAGGIEGGISNGEDIIIHVFHKPLATLTKPLNTVDIKTRQKAKSHVERSDVCVVPRAGVVSEAMLAFILAQAFLEKFGGDNIEETKRNFKAYKKSAKIK